MGGNSSPQEPGNPIPPRQKIYELLIPPQGKMLEFVRQKGKKLEAFLWYSPYVGEVKF